MADVPAQREEVDMIRLLAAPLMFMILLVQSVRLALGQIWANKMRSALTTIGIVIGVASVTSVIAALTGLKTKVVKDFETLGTNKIFIVPHWPREGKFRHFNWRAIRFYPRQFEGILERCPSINDYTMMTERTQTVHYGVHNIEGARVYGINPSWHAIESRSVVLGRPFTLMDEENGWQVCMITPKVRDELRLERDCIGKRIVIDRRSFEIVGVVELTLRLALGQTQGKGHVDVRGDGDEGGFKELAVPSPVTFCCF